MILLGGCECSKTSWWRFLDPSAVVRAPDNNLTNPIYPSASTADETQELPPGATGPTRDDLAYSTRDYVIGPNDILDISVLDLFAEGLETVLRRQVTEGGTIDMPLLPNAVRCEGLTKDELRDALIQAYSPDILKSPVISVTVVLQRQNTFSIIGAVARPGSYNVTRKDMRLLDAMAMASGQSQTNINYLYVIRPAPARKVAETTTAQPTTEMELPPLPEIPSEQPASSTGPVVTPPLPPVPPTAPGSLERTREDLNRSFNEEMNKLAPPGGGVAPASNPSGVQQPPHLVDTVAGGSRPATTQPSELELKALDNARSTKNVYGSSGTSTKVVLGAAATTQPASQAVLRPKALPPTTQPVTSLPAEDPFGWGKALQADQARVIAIDLKKLNQGDPRMNIIIRDNDIINVPLLEQGEFYVEGEVQRPGVYSLTGRQVTIKMAVAAAGNMGPLAWPSNSILIRRIGNNQEQMIPVNVEAIYRGAEPDLFLKANDVLAVGTHVVAPFMAVIRNAFRLTYGFGFIYDRNFADPLLNPGAVDSERFERW